MNKEYAIAFRVVKKAVEFQRRLFLSSGKKTIVYKDSKRSQIVGKADIETEKMITQALKRSFPEDGILGEEFGLRQGTSGRLWIIDPVDGSQNFYHHIPKFGISVALQDAHGIALGIVAHSMIGEYYTALRGRGAMLNGKKARVSSVRRLRDASGHLIAVSTVLKPEIRVRAMTKLLGHNIRRLWVSESTVISSAEVAMGYVDYCVALRCSVWDVAATSLLIKEAGGKVTDLHGKPLDMTVRDPFQEKLAAVFSHGKLHTDIIRSLR